MGRQGTDEITPVELAELIGTIPYEIMLGFLPRVRRAYVE
jgi:alanine racemase